MLKYAALFLCYSFMLFANQGALQGKPTICLNMIVKDETAVIERCLNSVRDIIDYWVIVDTGSTDGTQNLIKETLKDIPGELYERPWVGFGHNRNEALEFAKNKADYLLFIDADEQLKISPSFTRASLVSDCYFFEFEELTTGTKFFRMSLISSKHQDWKWQGDIHEYLTSNTAKTHQLLPGIICQSETPASARSQDSKKYQKDVEVLENALKKSPDNSRYVFHLAQSYFCCEEFEASIKNFEKRLLMPDKEEEVYHSLYMIGYVKNLMNKPFDEVFQSYSKAYMNQPTRAEPLYRIGCLFLEKKDYLSSYAYFKLAASLPEPKGLTSIVEKPVYDYEALFRVANTAALIGKDEEALEDYSVLKAKKSLPEHVIKSINNNIAYLNSKKN